MAESDAGGVDSPLLEVECIQSLRHDEDYLCGRSYRISRALLQQYPGNFRPAGWRDEAAAARQEVEAQAAAKVVATQEDYERARDYQEFLEAQTEVELARARKERIEQLRLAAAEHEKDASKAKDEVTAVEPPPRAPPPQDTGNPLEARRPVSGKTAGPSAALPRAERLKRSAGTQ